MRDLVSGSFLNQRVGRQFDRSANKLSLIPNMVGWYDPSDLSTMYQDTAMSTPVSSPGDPVAIIMDKSRGLARGPENHTDVDFNDPAAWNYSDDWSVANGKASLTNPQTAGRIIREIGALVEIGSVYEVKFTVTSNDADFGLGIIVPGETPPARLVNGGETGDFVGYIIPQTGNQIALRGYTAGAGTIEVENFSVREVLGNHLVQPTSAARPTYQTDGFRHWLEFDGVDDKMYTSVASLTPNHTAAMAVQTQGADASAASIWSFDNAENTDYQVAAGNAVAGFYGQLVTGGLGAAGVLQLGGGDLDFRDTVVSARMDAGAGQLEFYQNGELKDTDANYNGGLSTDYTLRVASNRDGTGSLAMRMYAFVVYNNAVTPSGLRTIHNWLDRAARVGFPVQPDMIDGLVAWYDPSDKSTLFTSTSDNVSSGGDPVLIMLDKSEGLIREADIFVDGAVTIDPKWSGDISSFTKTETGNARVRVDDAEEGAFYEVTGSIANAGGTGLYLWKRNAAGDGNEQVGLATEGNFRFIARTNASDPAGDVLWWDGASFVGDLVNCVVRKIPGNHLFQETAASRPTYQTDGTLHWLDFDGVDDFFKISDTITVGTLIFGLFGADYSGTTPDSLNAILGETEATGVASTYYVHIGRSYISGNGGLSNDGDNYSRASNNGRPLSDSATNDVSIPMIGEPDPTVITITHEYTDSSEAQAKFVGVFNNSSLKAYADGNFTGFAIFDDTIDDAGRSAVAQYQMKKAGI